MIVNNGGEQVEIEVKISFAFNLKALLDDSSLILIHQVH